MGEFWSTATNLDSPHIFIFRNCLNFVKHGILQNLQVKDRAGQC